MASKPNSALTRSLSKRSSSISPAERVNRSSRLRCCSSDSFRSRLALPSALKASRTAPTPKPSTRFGGARSTNCAQHVGDRLELAREGVDLRGIAFAEFCDGLFGAAFAGQEIAAIGSGQEVLGAPFDDTEAVIGQVQIGDDLAG